MENKSIHFINNFHTLQLGKGKYIFSKTAFNSNAGHDATAKKITLIR